MGRPSGGKGRAGRTTRDDDVNSQAQNTQWKEADHRSISKNSRCNMSTVATGRKKNENFDTLRLKFSHARRAEKQIFCGGEDGELGVHQPEGSSLQLFSNGSAAGGVACLGALGLGSEHCKKILRQVMTLADKYGVPEYPFDCHVL